MAKLATGQRIQSKTTLVQAIELIGSDKIKDSSKKPARWVFVADRLAQQILLKVVGPDANTGWRVLRALDNISMYGSQIPIAFNDYCIGQPDLFIKYVLEQDNGMIRWVDKQRQVKESKDG